MSTYNFTEWLQTRQNINESEVPKAGDRVYFGIHDLMRNDFSPDSNSDKIGQVVDVDPIEEKIKVVSCKDPFHMGYHRLESSRDRKKRKTMSKDGNVEVMIPSQNFKDISGMTGDGSKLWLVVDRGTKYQQGLNKKLNKYMHKGPEETPAPQDSDDVQYMQAQVPQPMQTSQVPQMMQTQQPQPGGYKMMNREVVPTPIASQPANPMGQLGWKRHVDPRTYGYV